MEEKSAAYLIALDQGTTSSRTIIFDRQGHTVAQAQYAFKQHYPQLGWVEHDPEEILASQYASLRDALAQSGLEPGQIAAIGVTNQRETSVIWEKESGRPIYPAIVWQCRRTAALCEQLQAEGLEEEIRSKTGLPIDAYFSATKFKWILEAVPGAKRRAEAGELLAGTIESWLIWNLSGGKTHISDHTNAGRTMLFDIDRLCWDQQLCRHLGIPPQMLPEPVANAQVYGRVTGGIKGLEALAGLPIAAAIGDQQSSLFGQGCFQPGSAKNTYGTGCFALLNSGNVSLRSRHGLLASPAWTVGGQTTYTLEGSVFNAGSVIQWLRDELGLIETAAEISERAAEVADSGGVYLVPAFTGLGAPHWDMFARGAILGLTRGSNRSHLCRAALEGIAYQVKDLLLAMAADIATPIKQLRVDGGAARSDLLLQFQADLLRIPIVRPENVEATALGAAMMAGLGVGLWRDISELQSLRQETVSFEAQMPLAQSERLHQGWQQAVATTCAYREPGDQ